MTVVGIGFRKGGINKKGRIEKKKKGKKKKDLYYSTLNSILNSVWEEKG